MNLLEKLNWNWIPRRSAHVAKERLQILVAHERAFGDDRMLLSSELLEQLRHELLKVVGRYIHVDADHVQVQLQKQGEVSILELNVTVAG